MYRARRYNTAFLWAHLTIKLIKLVKQSNVSALYPLAFLANN